ncbi:protein N-lysine methyltransferase METTL21A-like [Hibiscus syriacus]|uniref:protein N-lysine methyltransferase METTL21A-like n=1 Tax=Hibiscus syriacus TaxID=106335 RepID=UPI001924A16A|nr:protein N-lysine methyltransferase METTL21A-like [Hibiscus syriacus]
MLLNDFLSKNAELLQGCSMIELGSGVGITGMLCSRFCRQILLTDHNEEVLKILRRNIELNASAENPGFCAALEAEKLEWGNSDQINKILHRYPGGFDLILAGNVKTCP